MIRRVMEPPCRTMTAPHSAQPDATRYGKRPPVVVLSRSLRSPRPVSSLRSLPLLQPMALSRADAITAIKTSFFMVLFLVSAAGGGFADRRQNPSRSSAPYLSEATGVRNPETTERRL